MRNLIKNIYLYLLIIFSLTLVQCSSKSDFAANTRKLSADEEKLDAKGDKSGGQTDTNGIDGTNSDGTNSDGTNSDGTNSDDTKPADESCVDGDKVKFNFAEKVKKCTADGSMWNFDTGVCTTMKKAAFSCGFKEMIAEIKKIKPTSSLIPEIEKFRDKGSKVVGCGQAADKKVLVGQMWIAPENKKVECNYNPTKSTILTFCLDGTGEIPQPVGENETKNFVLKCMNAK